MASKISALISLFLLLVLSVALYTARNWSPQAGLFPRTVGAIALVLVLGQLILDLVKKKKAETEDDGAGLVDLPVDRSVPVREVVRRGGKAFGWIFGLALTIWAIGFGLAIPLFLFLYIFFQAKERWWVALAIALLMALFQYVVFDRIIHTNWPVGAVQQWFE